MINLLGVSLASLCFIGSTEAFLKKHSKQDNNGWAQYGFGNPAPGPTAAYPPSYNLSPAYQKLPIYYPQPYYPSSKYGAPVMPKLNILPKPAAKLETPHQQGKFAYPVAYLPAYYMRLDNYGYQPAPKEPFLSKLGLRKFRKGDYGYGAYGGGQGQHYGYPIGYRNPAAYGNVQPDSKAPGPFPSSIDCPQHADKYLNVGGRWQEDPPYQYTGHRFGVPVKNSSQERNQP